MLSTLARRAVAGSTRPPLTIYTNPYRTKKIWPPDYKQLSRQEQFGLEKKYKRRVILASRRPKWDKGIKLAQLVTTVGILSWLFFYAELEFFGQSYKPKDEIRKSVGTLWGVFDEENRYDRNSPEVQAQELERERKNSRA